MDLVKRKDLPFKMTWSGPDEPVFSALFDRQCRLSSVMLRPLADPQHDRRETCSLCACEPHVLEAISARRSGLHLNIADSPDPAAKAEAGFEAK